MKKGFSKSVSIATITALSMGVFGCSAGNVFNAINPMFTANTFNSYDTKTINKVHVKASQFERFGYVPDEIIVKYRNNMKTFNTATVLQQFNLQAVKNINSLNVQVVKTNAGSINIMSVINKLKQSPDVLYAEPNYIATAYFTPNDPKFKDQYAPQIVKAPEGWEISTGDKNVIVSIVDTGVDMKHPDLAAKIVQGYDMVDKDDDPMDGQGHGTHCAGIAAAITDNAEGVAGIAPKCSIMPVRVLDDNGSGTYDDVAEGIVWAAEHGANVISMSLGGRSSSKVVEDAVNLALKKDVAVIAAMGNDGKNVKCYPAAIPGVIAVGSTDKNDKRSSFSNYGEWISVSAPGSSVLSTLPTYENGIGQKNYGSLSGTSMATPATSGLAGLIRSKFPKYDIKQVRAALEKGDDLGKPGFDNEFGNGRINVYNSLK